jgi:hypothetical protein
MLALVKRLRAERRARRYMDGGTILGAVLPHEPQNPGACARSASRPRPAIKPELPAAVVAGLPNCSRSPPPPPSAVSPRHPPQAPRSPPPPLAHPALSAASPPPPSDPSQRRGELMPSPGPCSLLRSSARPAPPSSRGPRLPRGPSHRTGLVGRTSGSSGRRGPGLPPYSGAGVSTRSYPSPSVSWTGATTTRDRSSLHRSTSDTSPRSAKYALRSPRSTGEKWLKAHQDRRSW